MLRVAPGPSRCASSITRTTRRRRSCSSAASRLWVWAINSALKPRGTAPRALHDGHVQAAGADGRVGQVHDVVRGLVELADGGAHGDGLADADLAGDDAQQRLGDAEADARDGFLVTRSVEQVFGRDVLGERSLVKPKWVTQGARVMADGPHRLLI